KKSQNKNLITASSGGLGYVGHIVRFCFHDFRRNEPRRYSSWPLTQCKLFGALALASCLLRAKKTDMSQVSNWPQYQFSLYVTPTGASPGLIFVKWLALLCRALLH